MADQVPNIKVLGVSTPRLEDGDLPGYKPKKKITPAPYVKDASGMIWQWEPWMSDLGDVLEPCWEAPPKPKIQIANSPMDIAAYGKQLPQQGEKGRKSPVRAKGKKRKGTRKPKPTPMGPYRGDAGTGASSV